MIDTPRTDEAECEAHIGISHFGHQDLCDAYKFARQLERELNAANADVERLTKANLQLRKGCEELQQRIKRLEDSRDKIKIYCDTILARDWKEAKEAKP